MAKVKVTQSGRVQKPKLDNGQLTHIGNVMVAAQKDRWARAINADGNPAKKLTTKYAIHKGSFLRLIGDPRGSTRVKRDLNMTGILAENFALRKAINGVIRAENSTRLARDHAKRADQYEQMIGFSPTDQTALFKDAQAQYGALLKKAWVPIAGTKYK